MFAVVFTQSAFAGGAHPNSDYATLDFLLPDGAQVFLPEIVDGSRGISRISQLAIATLNRTIGSGPDAASDPETIAGGAGPLADNFKHFVWLPNRLHIYFPPYQVVLCRRSAGRDDFAVALRDVIRPDWRAPAPSFDCRKAASMIEHAICSDAAVARLRPAGRRNLPDQDALRLPTGRQAESVAVAAPLVASRNHTCVGAAAVPCLTKFYRDRLAVLNKNPI